MLRLECFLSRNILDSYMHLIDSYVCLRNLSTNASYNQKLAHMTARISGEKYFSMSIIGERQRIRIQSTRMTDRKHKDISLEQIYSVARIYVKWILALSPVSVTFTDEARILSYGK